ncbi:MAG TPA: methionine/alanine import family NSS transporter small subunit [Halanaerobiales bacterium]|nr:methionine/alanine import family NSS transporter small subunit [Halanaerobiales bacterium]
MSTSAIIMLIFAVIILFGGLSITIKKALDSRSEDNN